MRTQLMLVLLMMLVALTSLADIDRNVVGFRVVSQPRPVGAGELVTVEIEIVAGQEVMLYDVRLDGPQWSGLQVTQPDRSYLAVDETARFTVSGTPETLNSRVQFTLGTDRGDFGDEFDIRAWARSRKQEANQLVELPTARAAQLAGSGPSAAPSRRKGSPPLFQQPVDDPGYGIDSADTDDPPGQKTIASTIHVVGQITFERNDGVLVGLYGATVRLYDEDSTWDEWLGTTTTDEYGWFVFDVNWDPCWLCDSTPDLYVEAEAENDLVEVEESHVFERNYRWVTPTWDDYGGSNLEIGTWYINYANHAVAADILTTITRGYEWLNDEHGITLDKVDVQWPSNECSSSEACYKPFTEEIHISTDRNWDRGVYLHEWGHHLMENWGSNQDLDYCNDGNFCDGGEGCGHCGWCSENAVVALQEGFPNWLADVVLRFWAGNWPAPPFNNYDNEEVSLCQSGPDVWGDPETTEGFFAALLRDIEDNMQDGHQEYSGSNGAHDRLNDGAHNVMQVVLGFDDQGGVYLNPASPSVFLEQYRARFPGRDSQLWSTARNCGYEIDTTAPLHPNHLDSSSHIENLPSPNAWVTLTWDLPVDDISGLKGFSYRLTSANPGMPDETLDVYLEGEVTVGPFNPGSYYFTIRSVDQAGNWSTYYSTFGPFVIRETTPVDLAYSDNMGWDFPLVPRSNAQATMFDVSLTPTLPGDAAGTWWNYSGRNGGEDPVPGADFLVGLYLDGEPIQVDTQPSVGGGETYTQLNVGPATVPGGRHTLEIRHDAGGQVMETDEQNNQWARQFVWTPGSLGASVAYRMTGGLPHRTGGHSFIEDGIPVFDNCRGHAFSGILGWSAVALTTPDEVDDFNLKLFPATTGSENGFTSAWALSNNGNGLVDAVFVNGYNTGAIPWNVGVIYQEGHRDSDYDIQHERSDVLVLGNTRSIWLGQNDHLDLTEIYFPASVGPLTVKLTMDPGDYEGHVRIGRLVPQVQYSSMNTLQDVHTLGASGLLEFEIATLPEGSNCFVVYRNPQDSSAPYAMQLSVEPQKPNIVPVTLSDWDGPIIPTRTALTGSPVALPSYLPGDVQQTYFNWGLANQSHNQTGSAFAVRVQVDGGTVSSHTVPTVYGGFAAWDFGQTAFEISGGRHSIALITDTLNEVDEFDESDNTTGDQFVWKPVSMHKNTTITRSSPPSMVAGWEDLAPGSFHFNCDGVRTPVFEPGADGYFAAVATLPISHENVDLKLFGTSGGPQNGFSNARAISSWGVGLSDYVLADFTTARDFEYDAGVYKNEGNRSYQIQNRTSLDLGYNSHTLRYGPFYLNEGEIVALHDLSLPDGTHEIRLINSSTADLGISWHLAGDAFQGKSDARSAAWFAGPGENETIFCNPDGTVRQCIVVWKRNTDADISLIRYFIEIEQPASDVPEVPVSEFVLHPCVPNPFNPMTTITFDQPRQASVDLRVYDVSGQLVKTLLAGEVHGSGRHSVTWNGTDNAGHTAAAGTYFYRMEADGFAATGRMTLIK